MAKNIFAGVNNIAKKPKDIYVGVNGIARKVKAAYVGVNGVARQCWPNSKIPNGSYQEVEWTRYVGSTDIKITTLPRIKIDFSVIGSGRIHDIIPNNSLYVSKLKYFPAHRWYDSESVNLDTGEKGMWIEDPAGYYVTRSWSADFSIQYNYFRIGEGYDVFEDYDSPQNAYGRFEYNSRDLTSEGILADKVYSLDFMNGNKAYLSCTDGYFSVASHQTLATFNKYPLDFTPDSQDSYIRLSDIGATQYNDYVKIYYVELLSGSTYLRKLVPCYRVSDGNIGMYDLVENYFIAGRYSKNDYPWMVGPTV